MWLKLIFIEKFTNALHLKKKYIANYQSKTKCLYISNVKHSTIIKKY